MKKMIVLLIMLSLLPATVLRAQEGITESKLPNDKPRVEVVFVLDTTGSMGGLIHAAQEKIWSIANTLATASPAPEIKIGLVGYRDRGDAYITRLIELSDDLDSVYKELMAFSADGGGDGPESVNQALHEAVTNITWSKDENTYRVIFLVGDYPPHMDYTDDIKYPQTCRQAAEAGIVINTIQCGSFGQTEPIWSEIARLAEGRYFQVEQSGSAILAATPFDTELAELSRKLDQTRLYYGSAEVIKLQMQRMEMADGIYAEASDSALAQRAAFNSGKAGERNFLGSQELINDIETGQVTLAGLDEDKLPDDLKTMSDNEREAFVKEKSEQRRELQAQIRDLSDKRQNYLKEQIKNSTDKTSLDHGIYECIQGQAARRGITYEAGPSL
ncbi:MAG: VWA domain-containing protein [Sedimentisphaerales bacterium]|nr:VWA domain-containing protein [Sedimentisphaerales bacterium]